MHSSSPTNLNLISRSIHLLMRLNSCYSLKFNKIKRERREESVQIEQNICKLSGIANGKDRLRIHFQVHQSRHQ
jgi:hypothetical protein